MIDEIAYLCPQLRISPIYIWNKEKYAPSPFSRAICLSHTIKWVLEYT